MATHGMHDTAGIEGIDAGADLARLARLLAPVKAWGAPCPSGFRAIDRLLPAGGICRGSLVEWIGTQASGASALVFAVASRLRAVPPPSATGAKAAVGGPSATSGTVLVVDRSGRFHPPAVLPWFAGGGTTPSASRSRAGRGAAARDCGPLVVVRPSRDEDEIWAIDQALRSPGVAAVVAWPERVTATTMRRWQLAARSGGAVGLLVRPPRSRREPSWAEARVSVTAVGGADGRAEGDVGGGAPDDAVRLVATLAVRRFEVRLVEGPWACDRPPDAPCVEIALDLMTGREATAVGSYGSVGGGRVRLTESAAARDGVLRPMPQMAGGVPCRAS